MDTKEIKAMLKSRQLKNKTHNDKHAGRGLEPLKAGDPVFVYTEKSWKPRQVLEHHSSPRSYVVQASDGRKLTRRNRRSTLTKNRYRAAHDDRNDEHIEYPFLNTENVHDRSEDQHVDSRKAPKPNNQQVACSGREVKLPKRFVDYVE